MPDSPAIIVFDGHCPLCSAHARFILKHDRRGSFRLAAMQSEAGAALYRRFGIDPTDPETLILVEDGWMRHGSDAVLAIWSRLGWPWRLSAAARLVPAFLRDRGYRWLARSRYRLFGRHETCWVPPPEWRDRLL